MKAGSIILAMLVSLVLIVAGKTYAEGEGTNVTEDSTVTEVGNKLCPISGEKVGEMGEVVKVEHNGKVYNLCCKMCIKDFKKDPEKYIKKIEEQEKANVSEQSTVEKPSEQK